MTPDIAGGHDYFLRNDLPPIRCTRYLLVKDTIKTVVNVRSHNTLLIHANLSYSVAICQFLQ